MIELPSIPHDNLYKFISFAGLAIIISVNYLYYSLDARYEEQFINNTLERLKLDHQDDIYHDQAVKWLEKVDPGKEARDDLTSEQRQEALDLSRKMRENRLKEFEVKAKEVSNGLLFQRRNAAWWLYWIGSIIGLSVLVFGISLWYLRVQRPQDQFLIAQIKGSGEKR